MKKLVVYFSRKGYVKKYALDLAKKENADIYEIVPTEPIKGTLGFWWCGRFGMHRWGMPIEEIKIDMSKYDHVILCSPVWVFTVSAPMWEFINKVRGIKEVEYVLMHFSFPMKYKKTLIKMDNALGLKHTKFTSICSQVGHILKVKEYSN